MSGENQTLETCSIRCPFYLRYKNILDICRVRKDEGLSEPYCYYRADLKQSCRFGFTREQISALARSGLNNVFNEELQNS
jgi:hypothetical protein